MAQEFKLSLAEIHQSGVQKILKTLDARLQAHRKKNDMAANEIDTAKLRGRIAEIKELQRIGSTEEITNPEVVSSF